MIKEEKIKDGIKLSDGKIVYDGDYVIAPESGAKYKVRHNGCVFVIDYFEGVFPSIYNLSDYKNRLIKKG